MLKSITTLSFSDVVTILMFADASALPVADRFLAILEGNEIAHVAAPKSRNATDADVTLHDLMIDSDPLFLEWDSVQRTRNGQTWVCFAEGVDVLPSEVQ